MTITIRNDNSSYTTSAVAFSGTGPDTLIVADDGFLIANPGFEGALLTGAWDVVVDGTIWSLNASGLRLQSAGSFKSTLKVGPEGSITGYAGFSTLHPVDIINNGEIVATGISGVGLLEDYIGDSRVTNNGLIKAQLGYGVGYSGLGTHTLVNHSVISGSIFSIEGAGGQELITNTGVLTGDVKLGANNDVFTDFKQVGKILKHGTVVGTIDLGDGTDTFRGGNHGEIVKDGNGSDVVLLSGGNDIYIASGNTGSDGSDQISGGSGRDTYDASGTLTGNLINLDIIAHDLSPINSDGLTSATTAVGSGLGTDTITGFENAKGGSAYDAIYGNAAANEIDGGGSGDNLFGYGGNDTLHGGAGEDGIAGGSGSDILYGDAGDDIFQFFKISDSGAGKAARDVIMDFQADGAAGEAIDVYLIDAITTNTNTNDDFTFIGTNVAFGGVAGQLRAVWNAAGQVIQGDVNGDKKVDFSIEVIDPNHLITFSATDAVDFYL